MLRWYQAKLASKPVLTQSITTAILFASGDTLAQHAVEDVDEHSWARTARMGGYGGFVFGPMATFWFRALQKHIKLPGRPGLEIAGKVAADQAIFAPVNLTLFLSSMAVLEGTSPKEKLRSRFAPALQKNWLVWPWVQALNFRYVPLEHRVLVVNGVALGWNCYLSYLNSQVED